MLLGPDSFSDPEQNRVITDKDRKALDLERRQQFEEIFGSVPRILAIKTELMPIWPGGGVLDFVAPKLHNTRVTVSFGLSNIDMPRTQRVVSSTELIDSGNHQKEWTTEPVSEPMPSVEGRSGYGYELICLSREGIDEGEISPEARLIFTFVEDQLNSHRVNALDRAQEAGARIFKFEISDFPDQYYVLAPAWDVIPEKFSLSSGDVRFMMAMRLTNDEVIYSQQFGPNKLLDALKSSGILPICDDERSSAV